MKIANVMNFVRYIDERAENSTERLLKTTTDELRLVNSYGIDNTFLLQYDAYSSKEFVDLFKNEATEKTELGIWYEIVEPLTSACGIEYKSSRGWKWDWHIVPGFSMAYTPKQREMLADEAMRKFKEVFGYYPKVFASWLIDTHTVNYLADKYDISAFAICRDQVSTDAYTLIGGYFNQAYYPSRNNVFTPASSDEERVNSPVFRLLGPCPIHDYEASKYLSDEAKKLGGCHTLEACWNAGRNDHILSTFLTNFYEYEDLGFSYAQLGQENSFGLEIDDLIPCLKRQLDKLTTMSDVTIMKMGETGEWFKKTYPGKTPATALSGLKNWDSEDIQSVYYDCQKYSCNIMRYEEQTFIRALFLFDERVKEKYLTDTCTTFDAVYENLPVINNLEWNKNKKFCGLLIDGDAKSLTSEKSGDGILTVGSDNASVIFDEEKITVKARSAKLYLGEPTASVKLVKNCLNYIYNGNAYSLEIGKATVNSADGYYEIVADGDCFTLTPNVA